MISDDDDVLDAIDTKSSKIASLRGGVSGCFSATSLSPRVRFVPTTVWSVIKGDGDGLQCEPRLRSVGQRAGDGFHPGVSIQCRA
jgi:hypothetical protein